MIIEKVTLCNWQGYHGNHEFNFKGSGGRYNSFIYADNTVGKTAFWEAISFVLFGRVKRRRGVNQYRPFIAENSGDYPLMNTDEWGKPGANFHVELFFSHEGVNYRLFRGYIPKIENRPVRNPNDMKQELELENLDSRAGRERFIEDANRWIGEKILPERLAKFFLFDGERLEEYEDLMRRDDDILLRDDIENIIRSPILREGRDHLRLAKSRFHSLHGEANVNATKDRGKRKQFQDLTKEIGELEKRQKELQKEIHGYSDEIGEVEDWLADNDETKTAAVQIQELKKLKQAHESAIKASRKGIIRNMKGAWKTIISTQVKDSLETLDGEKEEQATHVKNMNLLTEEIEHLNHELEGKPCTTCKRERVPLDEKGKKEVGEKITSLKIEYDQHRENSKYPTVEEYVDRYRALKDMDTEETNLTELFDVENSLMDGLAGLRRTERDLSIAEEKISEEKSQQVKGKLEKRVGLIKKKAIAEDEEKDLVKYLGEQRDKMKEFSDLREPTDEDTTKMKRLAKSVEVATELSLIFEDALSEHRENMRSRVEKTSTEIFLQISNNSENYNGLKITSGYTVSIDNKKGRRDAGSQAQSLVMAYSIIDALASCSGFEFPMIVDTPGRSLAKSNVNSVFDHFTSSDRQAIFLPNDRELDPDDGDERYGKLCAATYELRKADEDRTEVVRRVNNLE